MRRRNEYRHIDYAFTPNEFNNILSMLRSPDEATINLCLAIVMEPIMCTNDIKTPTERKLFTAVRDSITTTEWTTLYKHINSVLYREFERLRLTHQAQKIHNDSRSRREYRSCGRSKGGRR